MRDDGLFHLDRADVLTARDDDVLHPVAELDGTIGMKHGDVAAVEPPTGERLLRRLYIVVVALHDDIAAHDDLAHDVPDLGVAQDFLEERAFPEFPIG